MSGKTTNIAILPDRAANEADTPLSAEDVSLGLLDGLIGFNLRRAQAAEFQRFVTHFAPYDIRPLQFSMMTLVRLNPGMNQSQMGNALGIKPANVVTLVNELQARGLIERIPSVHDRRSYTLRLTDAGMDLSTTLLEVHERHEKQMVDALGPERRDAFIELLKIAQKVTA